MRELITATVTTTAPVSRGTLTLTLAGAQYRADLAPAPLRPATLRIQGPGVRRRLRSARRPGAQWPELSSTTSGSLPNASSRSTWCRTPTSISASPTTSRRSRNCRTAISIACWKRCATIADMRFSLDGVWLAEQYLRTRSPAAQKEFLDAVRAGRISIPAQYANLMAGGAGLETLIRSTYAGRRAQSRGGQHRATTPTSPMCRRIPGATRPCWPPPASNISPRAPTTTAARSRSTAAGRPVRPSGGRVRMAQRC